MIRALPFLLLATPALAGGLEDHAVASEPCPAVTLRNDGSMTDEMFRQWLAVRGMSCPDHRQVFIDRSTGRPLTDAEVLHRVFNGSGVSDPSVVPLPASAWLLVAGMGLLARRARA